MLSLGARFAGAFKLLFAGTLPPDTLSALLADSPLAPATAPEPAAPPPAAPPVEDRGDRAVQLLALLQRDGRLVDFLREDLAPYSDAQVGTAARDVHARCRAALERYIRLEPVAAEEEGDASLVSAATDAASTRIVGNVPSQGSARGVVRHRGWRAVHVELPPLPIGDARRIVAPAEIEVA